MALTDQQLQETLAKSGIRVLDSRAGWAVTYLVQAGLISRPRRGINEVTDRGLAVLKDHPDSGRQPGARAVRRVP